MLIGWVFVLLPTTFHGQVQAHNICCPSFQFGETRFPDKHSELSEPLPVLVACVVSFLKRFDEAAHCEQILEWLIIQTLMGQQVKDTAISKLKPTKEEVVHQIKSHTVCSHPWQIKEWTRTLPVLLPVPCCQDCALPGRVQPVVHPAGRPCKCTSALAAWL